MTTVYGKYGEKKPRLCLICSSVVRELNCKVTQISHGCADHFTKARYMANLEDTNLQITDDLESQIKQQYLTLFRSK